MSFKDARKIHLYAALAAYLALGALVSTAGQADAFDADKLYRYDFEGTITTKVADDEKPQYAGVAIRSPIVLKKSTSDELIVKLEKPQLATFNDVIGDLQAYKFDYKPIERANTLDKAFRIYFEDGSVKSFDTYKDEPKWVTNLKRGLLSFFQLKLKSGNGDDQSAAPDSSGQYYTTAEKSVFGECETDYLIINQSVDDSGANYFNVTKTRNMAKCKTRFLHRFMPIDSTECYENEKDSQQYKHSNAIFQYNLVGTRQNYVIRQVQLDEMSTFSPFGQKAHSHLVQSKFTLRLDRAESEADSASLTSDLNSGAARIDSLSYDPPELINFYANVNLEDEHHLSNIYQTSASVEQVMRAFDALVQEHRQYTSAFESNQPGEQQRYQDNSRLAERFMRLNELVGTLNSQKIEQLYGQVDERGEAHKKIFWDLMSVVGTNPSFMFMKKMVTEGDVPSVKIKEFLTRLSYHIKMPSKSLFDEYVNLCKSDKIQTNQQYKRLCSLPLASLIHQHCAKPHAKYLRTQQEGANATAFKKAQNTCQIASAEEYFSRLIGPISSSGAGSDELSLGDKMFNIKMAGELGVRPSIEYLAEIIRNRDEHPTLRSAAMWGLMKAAAIYPAQVKRLVIPYYYDQGELLDLRIAAYYNWFYSGMSLHELETLAKHLASEPSRQLVIYIHSMLKSVSELTTSPCSHPSEKNARLVLATIKRALRNHAQPTWTDSQVSLSNTWQPDFGYGTSTVMSAIFSNESMAPSNLYYSSAEIMSGLKLSPMSVSVMAHGLDKLIKRVVGIKGLLADKESFMDVFSLKRRARKRRQASAELIKQEEAEIERELKLATREFSDVYLAVIISAYGRPITFFDKDSRELKKMLSEDGTIKIPQIKKLLHSFNNHTTQQMMITFEKLEVLNNELGLPLYRSISDFDYKTFKLNSVKLDVEPGFFKDERQGKPPSKLSASLDAKVGKHNEIVVSSGALLLNSRQQVGAGFYKRKVVNYPIKVAVDANLAEGSVSLRRQPIAESLLYIKQYPVTFVRSYAASEAPDTWRPLYNLSSEGQMRPFRLEYMTPLALGIRLEGKHRAGQDWSLAAWRRYLGQVGLQAAKFAYFYSPTGAPLELRLSTVSTAENPTKELAASLSWRRERPGGAGFRLALVGGSVQERRVSLELDLQRSADRLRHTWRLFYQRTPLELAEPGAQTTNLCWLGALSFPQHSVHRLLRLELLELDHSANLTSELTFGDQCAAQAAPEAASASASAAGQPRVSLAATFGWSAEQRAQLESALGARVESADEAAKNGFLRLHRQCLRRRELAGNPLEPACLRLMERASELTHLSALVDHNDVPERWTKLVGKLGSLYTYARAGYIDELDDRPRNQQRQYRSPDGRQERAHLEANLTGCAASRALSYELDSAHYHVLYRNLPMSLPPLSTLQLLDSSYLERVSGRDARSLLCSLAGQTVTTFDNLTYTMPAVGDGCLKLVAKDCSPENNFAVLAAKVGAGQVLKVYVGQKFKVEFVPDKDGKRISDIKVNGETAAIEPAGAPLVRDTKLGARSVEAFKVENNGAFYTLRSALYRFAVSTDGTWILVQQSKYYAGKSCGICGDANGDQLLEFKSPSSPRRVCRNTSDFVWSYVLPSTCASRPTSIECA